MRAILIDLSDKKIGFQLRNSYQGVSTQIVNKPLLEIQIEHLKRAGIKKITILTNSDIPEEMKDGKRWNVELDFIDSLPAEGNFENDEKDVLILLANIMLDLDIRRFIDDHRRNKSSVSEAISDSTDIAEFPKYFHPILFKSIVLKEISQNLPRITPQQFAKTICNSALLTNKFVYNFKIHFIDTHLKYWKLHKQILKNNPDTLFYPGFPLNDKIWIDVDSRLHPQTDIDGIVIIGKNSKVHKDVSLKGFVVIGDNVIVDNRAHIENSIIMNDTYIGTDIHIKDSIAKKNFLFQADKNIGMVIDESFIISATAWGMRFFAGLGRFVYKD